MRGEPSRASRMCGRLFASIRIRLGGTTGFSDSFSMLLVATTTPSKRSARGDASVGVATDPSRQSRAAWPHGGGQGGSRAIPCGAPPFLHAALGEHATVPTRRTGSTLLTGISRPVFQREDFAGRCVTNFSPGPMSAENRETVTCSQPLIIGSRAETDHYRLT